MSRLFIHGLGAVSPAGWGVPPLLAALGAGTPLPTRQLPRPGNPAGCAVRAVSAPDPRPGFLAHPRLRRASAISHYAMGAALEALGDWPPPGAPPRLGIAFGVHAASIRYSERFFAEVLRDPATASPLLFPETVINAPASHLAACLGPAPLTYSLVGDHSVFVQALATAAQWLLHGRVDAALVVSAEETAWTVADAVRYHTPNLPCAEGAGALVLSRAPSDLELICITESRPFVNTATRHAAAVAMRRDLPPGAADELLCDSRCGLPRADAPEKLAWAGWPGSACSPRNILGEALSAATAWQFIAAAARLRRREFAAANLSVVGGNQQAIGARLAVQAIEITQ